jgi:hypothetical protein
MTAPSERDRLRADYRRAVVRSHLTVDLHERAELQAIAASAWRALTGAAGFDGCVIALLVEGNEQVEYPDGTTGPKHCTICFCGDAAALDDTQIQALDLTAERIGQFLGPVEADVASPAKFGDTDVWLVESDDIAAARDIAFDDADVAELAIANEDHPHYIPHVSGLGDRDNVRFDRVAVLVGGEKHVFPLAGPAEPPDVDADMEVEEQGVLT